LRYVHNAARLPHQHFVRRVEIGKAEVDVAGASLGARHAYGNEIDAILLKRRNAFGVDDRDLPGPDAKTFGDAICEIDVVSDDVFIEPAEAETAVSSR